MLYQPTMQPTGLYNYDLDFRRQAEALQNRRRRLFEQPMFTAGGLHGATLQRQADIEGATLNAIVEARRRRDLMEQQRRTREASIAMQRRAQADAMLAGGIANATSSLVGQGIGAARKSLLDEGIL
ncbi:MAG: hypothetical protein ACYTFV_10900 [Planctomycetota bacterium]